jgi:hypothetical protein
MTAPAFVLEHNWESNVARKLSWKTDIIPMRNGAEQRRRLRSKPRETLVYTITTSSQDEAAQLKRLLHTTKDMRIAFPRWEDAMMLNVPLIATDTTVVVDAPVAPRKFLVDAMLYHESIGTERIVIDSILGDTITLLTPVENDWPAGVFVLPLVTGYVDPQIGGDDSSNLLATVVLTIEVEEDIAGITTGGAVQPMVPDSIDVYPHDESYDNVLAIGDVRGIVIEVKDASGTLIPDADIICTPFPGDQIEVYPTGMPNVWNVKNISSLGSADTAQVVVESGLIETTYEIAIQPFA